MTQPTPGPNDPYGGIITGNGGGGADKPDGNIVGETILMGGGAGGAGNTYVVKKSSAGALYFENTQTGGKALFGPGMYITADGRQLNVGANGDYKKLGELNQDQVVNYLTTGQAYNLNPDTLGGGAGADHYATDVAAATQKLLQQMSDLRGYWEQQIANVNSGVTLEQARAEFQKGWAQLVNDWETTNATLLANQQTTQASLEDTAKGREISDVREREIQEANRRLGVAQEATRRANIITGDVLPRFVTGNKPINVPFLGPTQGANVNFAELFNQGGAGNLNALPSIAPQFGGGYAPIQMPKAPQLAALPSMPTYPNAPVYPGLPPGLAGWLGV